MEDALQIGADAVSIHVNLGAEDEARMLRDFGTVSVAKLSVGDSVLLAEEKAGRHFGVSVEETIRET